jgi:hypothetical protein
MSNNRADLVEKHETISNGMKDPTKTLPAASSRFQTYIFWPVPCTVWHVESDMVRGFHSYKSAGIKVEAPQKMPLPIVCSAENSLDDQYYDRDYLTNTGTSQNKRRSIDMRLSRLFAQPTWVFESQEASLISCVLGGQIVMAIVCQ